MQTVKRHSALVRLSHWMIAISGIALLFSGFGQMPMYKRYFVTAIPGLGWSGDFELTLVMHYITAIVFTGFIVFHIVYHSMMGEFGAFPKRGDLKESYVGLKAMFGYAKEPNHEKFQAKQRVIYAIFGMVSLTLVGTGLIKTYKNLGSIVLDPFLLEVMAMVHSFMGGVFLILFMAHVAALLLKSHRPLIPSMFTGKLNAEYARKHHPAWKAEEG